MPRQTDRQLDYGLLPEIAGHQLRRLSVQAQRVFSRVFEDHNLTGFQYAALEIIFQNPGVTHRRICTAIETSPSVLTTSLKPILDREVLHQSRSPDDQRQVGYALTAKGKRWFRGLRDRIHLADDELLRALSSDERRQLQRLLSRLAAADEV